MQAGTAAGIAMLGNSGGEFLTVVWLLTAHLGIYEYAKFREPPRVYHNTHDLLRIDPVTVNLS